MSASVSNFKIIKPNDIKKEIIKSDKHYFQEVNDLISGLVEINKEYIEHSKAEVNDKLIRTFRNPLIQATHIAYSDHLPLILTPDIIWYCISNAAAIYINKYSEELRKTFVDHEGKQTITVQMLNRPGKEWDSVFNKLSGQIKEKTKNGIVDMLEANFSTTNAISKVSSQIVIMDAMQKYFDYRISTICGIPEIRLAGIKEDWIDIKKRTNNLVKLIPKFQNWVNILNGIFDQFINVFDGKIDDQFWNSIYKRNNTLFYINFFIKYEIYSL
jgi:Ni,Fe-hydrogenase maturation factor